MARLAVRVQNGTNAGWRTVTDKASDWTCANGHANKGCWRRCMAAGCNVKRPVR